MSIVKKRRLFSACDALYREPLGRLFDFLKNRRQADGIFRKNTFCLAYRISPARRRTKGAYFLFSALVEQHPQAPQFPPQEQECLPFFLSIIPLMTTTAKSTPITLAMTTVGTTGFIEMMLSILNHTFIIALYLIF